MHSLMEWNKTALKPNSNNSCYRTSVNLRKKSRWISHTSFAGSKATSCPYNHPANETHINIKQFTAGEQRKQISLK